MPNFEITVLDTFVFVAYSVLSRVVPAPIAGRSEDSTGYFLAGRDAVWPVIGLSLFATVQTYERCAVFPVRS